MHGSRYDRPIKQSTNYSQGAGRFKHSRVPSLTVVLTLGLLAHHLQVGAELSLRLRPTPGATQPAVRWGPADRSWEQTATSGEGGGGNNGGKAGGVFTMETRQTAQGAVVPDPE